jgi:2-polyprenyl-3-methyl-5-hydroxy-6-metoxy-1,4-benzoquinol methylase
MPWTTAIHEGQIESRKLVTNQAVIDAVLGRSPKTVFDIGCGEGWLIRELSAKGVDVYGVDVVPALVYQARVASGGRFEVLSYEDIACGKVTAKFDACVCNLALLGNESVTNLFGTMPSLLNPGGSLIVQTIHPVIGCGDQPYQDGWREGSWAGFSSGFKDPAPWYFRKLETWVKFYCDSGFKLVEMREPVHPNTGKPASAIFIGVIAG